MAKLLSSSLLLLWNVLFQTKPTPNQGSFHRFCRGQSTENLP